MENTSEKEIVKDCEREIVKEKIAIENESIALYSKVVEKKEQTNNEKVRCIVAKILRIITLPPITSAIMLVLMQVLNPECFLNVLHFHIALICICLVPVLSYLVSYIIPFLRKKGRKTQRKLAIIFSIVGYSIGLIIAACTRAPALEIATYSTYYLSVLLMLIVEKATGEKASGHACSTFGPICMLFYVFGNYALLGLLVLAVVFYSSLVLKRHTIYQLFLGSMFAEISFIFSIFFIM